MSKVTDIQRIMDEVLDKYRNSIPRKAFIKAMEDVIRDTVGRSETTQQNAAPGIQIIKQPGITAGELADILSGACPPFCGKNAAVHCDRWSCRECWLEWLTTGKTNERRD